MCVYECFAGLNWPISQCLPLLGKEICRWHFPATVVDDNSASYTTNIKT
jgi:hypothetical protein